MDPRWCEAFPYFKNLPNYGFVFVCTVSAQNVCLKWTFAASLDIYPLSGDQVKIQLGFGPGFGLFLATRYRQFSFKIFACNHFSTEQTNLICPFDAGETHTHTIVLVGMKPIISAIQLPNVIWPVAGHAKPHFWRETQMKTLQARQVFRLCCLSFH